MEVADALAVLGAEPGSSWEDIRRAYRDQLMANHPDSGGDASSAERTERVVEAFRMLRTVTEDGLKPLPGPSGAEPEAEVGDGLMVLHARPGDVFLRLCQAAEQIGHLSYADRDANLLQVMIGDDDWAPCQLTAELQAEGSLTMAMFSLEPLGVAAAPPIAEVVAKLAAELRSPAALD